LTKRNKNVDCAPPHPPRGGQEIQGAKWA